MTTREQAIEACRDISDNAMRHRIDRKQPLVRHAATLLTRDGKLRERLALMAVGWRKRFVDEFDCADELEAALKEDEK